MYLLIPTVYLFKLDQLLVLFISVMLVFFHHRTKYANLCYIFQLLIFCDSNTRERSDLERLAKIRAERDAAKTKRVTDAANK